MPIVSDRYGYLFLLAPRTGCSAVGERVLIPELAGEWLPPSDIVDETGGVVIDRKHATAAELRRSGLLPPARRRQLFVFTTVRNPFDSLVSQYVKLTTRFPALLDDETSWVHRRPGLAEATRRAAGQTFPEWVADRYGDVSRRRLRRRHRPRHLYGAYIGDADMIMRFERLQEDFDEALRRIGVDRRIELPRFNETARERDHRPYYDDAARRIVERAFEPDLRRFGYRF